MNWLVADWRGLLPAPWAQIVLALAAVICGGIVGTEREKREKPAGLRTLMLVCLGSTSFTMISYAFGTTTGDTGRIAAQVVTGIGFIGAGVILHGHNIVSGITTAATIWATSATGIVIGAGYVGAGVGLSCLIRGVLTGAYWWEHHFLLGSPVEVVELIVEPEHGKTRFRLEQLLNDFHVSNPLEEVRPAADGLVCVRVSFRLSPRQRLEFLNELASLEEVREMRQMS